MSAPFELPKGPLRYMLERILPAGLTGEAIRGDLLEEFRAIAERSSLRQARAWYRRQAVRVLWAVAWGRISRVGRGPTLGISWLDVKLGLRMLVKLTIVAVFTIAVGIPIGLLPNHIVNALQAPLPVVEADQIQVLLNFDEATSNQTLPSLFDFVQWREELTTFEALGATTRRVSYNVISEDGRAAPVRGAEVTASTFDILRVPPLLGRTLISADEVIGAVNVVVIGHNLWQSRLEGDPDVVGRTIRIGRVAHTVVGVMPEGFLFPYDDNLWLPLRMSVLTDEHGKGRSHMAFGRLSDGISPEEAQVELTTIGRRMATEFPDRHQRLQPEVLPFSIGFVGLRRGGIRAMPEFYLVQALALLVLVVACANVGMLIFARTATRSAELAVRTALGASRTRVISQLFTEALVFALLAAGVGLLLGDWISSRFDWMVVDELPYWSDLGVTRETVFWALSLSAFSAAVVGVVPALKVTGKAVQLNMQRAGAGRSGIRFRGISSALIVTDVALAMAVSGLAVGFSEGIPEIEDGMGIEADQFLAAELRFPRIESVGDATAFDQIEFMARVGATQQELVRRLAAQAGVRGVAVGSAVPRMDHPSRRMELDGENRSDEFRSHPVANAHVDVDFFSVLEHPILRGRGFDSNDLGEDRSAVIVNTTFVNRVLGGRNPIGRRVRCTREPGPWYEIVGVVGDLGTNETNPDSQGGGVSRRGPRRNQPAALRHPCGRRPRVVCSPVAGSGKRCRSHHAPLESGGA
jgi:putative ABC transport system permease protein